MASIYDIIASGGNAALLGAKQGVLDLGSTLDKTSSDFQAGPSMYDIMSKTAAAQAPNPFTSQMTAAPSSQQIQQQYENSLNQYNKNPDTNAHPLLAGIGRVGAQSAMTAPLFAAAGTSGLGLATAGILSAGMQNAPGQGDSLFNVRNAAYAAPIAAAGGLIQSAMPIVKNASDTLAPVIAKKAGMAVEDVSPMITGATDNTSGMVNLSNLADNVAQVAPETKAATLLGALKNIIGPYAQHFIPDLKSSVGAALGGLAGSAVGSPALGAAAGGIASKAIQMSPKVINTIFNNGSLTSTLKLISDAGDTLFSNRGATALIMNRINAQLTNAGINVLLNKENGNIELRHNTSDIENKATPIQHINPQALPQISNSSKPTQQALNMKANATA